jgi:hypothetical protein
MLVERDLQVARPFPPGFELPQQQTLCLAHQSGYSSRTSDNEGPSPSRKSSLVSNVLINFRRAEVFAMENSSRQKRSAASARYRNLFRTLWSDCQLFETNTR